MNKLDTALRDLAQMDELAAGDSPVHRLHPLTKLAVTILYIVLVVSYGKYEFGSMIIMLLFPLFAYQLSGIPLRTCFIKLRYVLPLVLAVGLFNPFLDKSPALQIGTLTVSGGVLSMLTLMTKGVLALMMSFLLAAATPLDSLCAALRKLHVPSFLVTLLLLTFRYVGLLMEEASVMTTAYRLRAPGQKGIHFSAWGSFLGQLLLRSMDRAEDLYSAMLLRGYRGDFPYAEPKPFTFRDAAVLLLCAAMLVLLRFGNLTELIGGLFVR